MNEFLGIKATESRRLYGQEICCSDSFSARNRGRRRRAKTRRKTGYTISIPTFIDVSSYERINTFHVCEQLAAARDRAPTVLLLSSHDDGQPDQHYYISLINKAYTTASAAGSSEQDFLQIIGWRCRRAQIM